MIEYQSYQLLLMLFFFDGLQKPYEEKNFSL